MPEIFVGGFPSAIESLYTEDEIGRITDKTPHLKISVYTTKEGDRLPHFHITSIGSDIYDCCVRIYQCGYFLHGEHTKSLISKDVKRLNLWLDKSNIGKPEYTNWEIIDKLWRHGYPNTRRLTNKKPDYSKLNEPLLNRKIMVDVDSGLTNRYFVKSNNSFNIKLGKDNTSDSNYCIIINAGNINDRVMSTLLKYVWYNKVTGENIFIVVPKNSDKTLKYKYVSDIF